VGASFLATDATAMEEVLLHSRPVSDATEVRRETWEHLLQLPAEGLVAPREAHEESGRRYEIYTLPKGQTLREWAAASRPSEEQVELLVQQIATELDAMHAAGIVHLQIHSRSIYVAAERGSLRARIGGLEAATMFAQSELIPITVNPFWAPPEAAGLYRHKAGDGLRAWDWWSLGRVVQELVHGGHVFSQLFGRDVSAEPFELRARAEVVLLERDASGVRAGAVELLPETTSARLRVLLRGLLTTVRDGRWRGDDVLRWVQSGTGPDRYDLPRDAQLFWWRGKAYTVAEVAAYFLEPDYAFDGLKQWFSDEKTREGASMREFLAETPILRAESERVEQILGFVDSLPWQQLALNARRAAVSGLAWRALAAADGPRLSIQRWAVDPQGMKELLADAPAAEALALVRVMGFTAYRRAVEAIDPVAGRTLALLGEAGFEALNQAVARGWIEAGSEEAHARLLWFAFETEPELLARRERLRTTYASVREPALLALFNKEKPTRTDLVLLAFLGENARRYGFVTHGDWTTERATTRREEAVRARTAVFWKRTGRLILWAPGLLGAWPLFLLLWVPALAIVSAAGGWLWGLALGAVALLLRGLAWLRLRSLVGHFSGGKWRLADGVRRARSEAAATMETLPPADRANPFGLFKTACADLQKLAPEVAAMAKPPRFVDLWMLAVLAQLVPLALCLGPMAGLDLAQEQQEIQLTRKASSLISIGADRALYELTNDGFGPRKRGPLKPWDVPSVEPRPTSVRSVKPASPNQKAYARVGGELLLEPYPRHDLKLTLAVPVESGDGTMVVLYDTEQRELADLRTFELREVLQDKTWYWLGNRRVVYLGVPPRLPAQNSLAQP